MKRREKLRRSGIRSERAKFASVAPGKSPREPEVRLPHSENKGSHVRARRISAANLRAAATGSAAFVMGLPTTR